MSLKHIPAVSQTTYLQSSGPIPYNMTNDYMFRAVLQTEKTALKHLICSLLRLDPAALEEVEVINPIILGDSIQEKEYHLDIHTRLRDGTRINLEMQTLSLIHI